MVCEAIKKEHISKIERGGGDQLKSLYRYDYATKLFNLFWKDEKKEVKISLSWR